MKLPLLTIQDAIEELKVEFSDVGTDKLTPIERIHVSTESLARILENISAMVNLSAGLTPVNRERYNIKDLIQTCYQRIRKMKSAFNWEIHLEEGVPDILFDYDLIELLFYNLAFHAMEFALPETTILIEAGQNEDNVMVSITAEGQSIPAEILEVAFENFYRYPRMSSSGLGLGLAIGKTIAEIHNGQLKVQNNPKGGMIFSFTLPIE